MSGKYVLHLTRSEVFWLTIGTHGADKLARTDDTPTARAVRRFARKAKALIAASQKGQDERHLRALRRAGLHDQAAAFAARTQ